MKLLGIKESLGHDPYLTCRVLDHMPRWSTVPVLRRQTVAGHCFLVARYCLLLKANLRIRIDMETALILALIHDDNELDTGDLPSPDKQDTSFDMPTVEHGLVKVADRLEAYCYVEEESAMGNSLMHNFVNPTWKRYLMTRDYFLDRFNVELTDEIKRHPWFRDHP